MYMYKCKNKKYVKTKMSRCIMQMYRSVNINIYIYM